MNWKTSTAVLVGILLVISLATTIIVGGCSKEDAPAPIPTKGSTPGNTTADPTGDQTTAPEGTPGNTTAPDTTPDDSTKPEATNPSTPPETTTPTEPEGTTPTEPEDTTPPTVPPTPVGPGDKDPDGGFEIVDREEFPTTPTEPDSGNQGGSTGGNEGGSTGGNEGGSTGGNEGGSTGGNQGGSTGGNEGGSTGGNQGGSTGGNQGGSTGGNEGGSTGGNQGGSTGGNQGGSTGGNQGGSTGGNQGGSTGGNQGGSTGGNQGGSTGGNQGGSTGGNQGGSTGGNEGGSTGGNQGGTTTPPTPPTPSVGTESGEYEELYVGNAYFVEGGDTTIYLADDVVNYFLYTPSQSGQYKVSIGSGTITYWGGNTVGYIADQSHTESVISKTSTSFTLNFMEGQVGSVVLIGVEGSGSTTLTITRVGASIEEKPWTVYNGLYKPTAAFTYTGGTLSVVDITGPTTKIYVDSNGIYHWGSPNGPVIYVKLNDKTDTSGYLSFTEWLNSERPVIKAAYGSGSSEQKWDFTACMTAYDKYKDKDTGYYPLNEDLKFMLEKLYIGQQWKDNIFANVTNLNEEMAWMFCCYYEKQ